MDYKITKEQVRAAYENKEVLKRLFPDAFKPNVGEWIYVVEGGDGASGCNGNVGIVCDKYVVCSGSVFNPAYIYVKFNEGNLWSLGRGCITRKATQNEIKTALLKEAERRGLTNGVKIKAPEISASGISKGTIEFGINYDNGTLFSSGLWIFKNGQWAEIISEPIELTLEDIAEKFGVSVEEIKIKK